MSLAKKDNSIVAIKQYISNVKSKDGDITRHKALVLTKDEGYPTLTYVGIVEGNCYTVIIETLPNEFITSTFKSDEYTFEYHNTNTLIIKGIKDLSNNDRTINISYVSN
jgi:hypothetical protein